MIIKLPCGPSSLTVTWASVAIACDRVGEMIVTLVVGGSAIAVVIEISAHNIAGKKVTAFMVKPLQGKSMPLGFLPLLSPPYHGVYVRGIEKNFHRTAMKSPGVPQSNRSAILFAWR